MFYTTQGQTGADTEKKKVRLTPRILGCAAGKGWRGLQWGNGPGGGRANGELSVRPGHLVVTPSKLLDV